MTAAIAPSPAAAPAVANAKQPSGAAAARVEASDAFFADPNIRVFDLELSDEALVQLRQSPRTYVRGTVRQGGVVLTNVGVHLKGMGSFRTVDEKASFAVKFDEFTPDQEFSGLTKLMFNNAVQDPTYVVEQLATGLFRDAGVPAARVTHARVRLNGRELGLYVVIEAMNKRFLKRHFGNAKGNLYETYVQDIDGPLDQDNGEDTSQSDIRALVAACAIPDPAERLRAVGARLDLDRFASFAAMEILVGHWDGYTIHTNNYRLYHDPGSDRLVFITHGLDWAFRRPNLSIQPPMKSLVGRAVFSTPEGQARFHERLGTLFTNVFRVAVLTQRMDAALARLRAQGGLDPVEQARMDRAAASIRERIVLRGTRVAEQLKGIAPPQVAFDARRSARITGWRDEYDRGDMAMDQPTLDGRRTLHLQAGGRSRGSWRAQVFLPKGRYVFEGEAQARGVLSGSAGLRISGGQRRTGLTGTTSWRPLTHAFEVAEDSGLDVEFICDFYATAGEVWFDADSLRVRRLTESAAETGGTSADLPAPKP